MKGEKLSTAPFQAVKKPERKVGKGKGKETRPGCFSIPLRPRGRTKVGGDVLDAPQPTTNADSFRSGCGGLGTVRPTTGASRYRLAGAAADELIDILGGNKGNDRGTWGYYCYHHDIETILEKAREIASRHRQGELKNPVTAFQRWLQRSYGREAV